MSSFFLTLTFFFFNPFLQSKSVEETIEEERAKVDAKTPITEEVFQKWKAEWDAKVKAAADLKLEERRRKGILSGREIFAEEGFVAQDDVSASDAYVREVDEEAAIKKMHEEAATAMEQAKVNGEAPTAAEAGTAAAGTGDGGGTSTAPTAAAAGGAKVELTEQEEEDLFGDDDDDDDGLLDELASDLKEIKT
jgi:DRG Family Regulatory Proteins, Tma46